MTALTLALLNATEVNSPVLAGTSREEKVLRVMNSHTRADIGLSPYAPSWLSA